MNRQVERIRMMPPAQSRLAGESEGHWVGLSTAIAHRISIELQSRNLMQKELAEMLGIKPQQVSRILKGNVNLTLETVSRFESALGIGLLEVPYPIRASSGIFPSSIKSVQEIGDAKQTRRNPRNRVRDRQEKG